MLIAFVQPIRFRLEIARITRVTRSLVSLVLLCPSWEHSRIRPLKRYGLVRNGGIMLRKGNVLGNVSSAAMIASPASSFCILASKSSWEH